ncbi:hypothetical protein ONS96_010623 [Cadophora gregata f. sp. sojae]|nr:hypothetical protein ONS96_010623 [Cadophora gregata f. sp. sojae]
MSPPDQSQDQKMAQERVQVLRDLLDIARVANGPQPPPVIPPPNVEPLTESHAGNSMENTSESSFNTPESSSNQFPPISSPKNKALTARDVNAIQYTKSQLDEGDTLVFIRFPNGKPVYDATGFRLSDVHRVHCDKLKAASPIFKKNLEDDWQQHRWRRRNKLLSGLPDGIQYILDLTPPEEGDDALALTAELSCSLGMRRWYKAEHSGVAAAHRLVGGKDETTVHPSYEEKKKTSEPASPEDVQEIIDIAGAAATAATVAEINGVGHSDLAFKMAMKESKRFAKERAKQTSEHTRDYSEKKEVVCLDYCPIRHRTGIERLLQIIEGKDPRLDSAPKVWTLAVLAKHFECHSAVVDYIVTWMIAEPNCKIFEILPEDCLRIGLLLQNEVATRYAFTILVSEEAFRIGTGRSAAANQPNTNYPAGKQVTKFGRARESLDEDTLNLIQHAGRNFHARIEQEMELLLSSNMNWLFGLQEFGKIMKFKHFLEATPNDARAKNVKKVIDDLTNYIRGRLIWCFYQPLDESERKSWNDHRGQERHETSGDPTDGIYNTLSEHEKLVTRFFWGCVRLLKWHPDHSRCATNLIHDSVYPKTPEINAAEERTAAAAEVHGIPKVYVSELRYSVEAMNKHILKSIQHENFNKGEIPEQAYKIERVFNEQGTASVVKNEHQEAQKNYFWKLKFGPEVLGAEPSPFNPMDTTLERPAFWIEALKARDEAIKTEPSSSTTATSPQAKCEHRVSWLDEVDEMEGDTSSKSPRDFHRARSANWDRLEEIWRDTHSSNIAPAVMPPAATFPDPIPNPNLSRTFTRPEATPSEPPTSTWKYRYEHDTSSTPQVPINAYIGPTSPFFNLHALFDQIGWKIQSLCNNMLSRGEIQNLRPPNCDIADTLLCLTDEEYKYLPLWANGLNDGTGGVFEEVIPPAERGGAVGPGPAYHTGSTVNSSRASTEIDFDGRSSVFGGSGMGDSEMSGMGGSGVNTSVGVEDGWSVDHIDRRRVFSESDFPTPGTSEDGDSVVWVGRDEDEEGDAEMTMNLPIREKGKGIVLDDNDEYRPAFITNEQEQAALLSSYSDLGRQSGDTSEGKGKGKEKVGDTDMADVQSSSQAQKQAVRAVSIDDDENFFNTPDGDEEFEFESDDEGEETETEDDFEHIG